MKSLPLKLQYDEYVSWLKCIVQSKVKVSDDELKQQIKCEKFDEKFGLSTEDIIKDIDILKKEIQVNDHQKRNTKKSKKKRREELKKQELIIRTEELASQKRLENKEYHSQLSMWMIQNIELDEAKLRKWVNANKLNKRFGVTTEKVFLDLQYLLKCKSQYLNVQKTENKNVHYPLLFRLTFQKSSLFLQTI